MMTLVIAVALALVIVLRVVGIVHQAMACQFARGRVHFLAFGYSYVLMGAAAGVGVVALCANESMLRTAVWLFMAASAGMILFDRRTR